MDQRHSGSRWVPAIALALMSLATGPVTAQAQSPDFVPVTDAMLQNPAPADWLMWRRTLDGWGYSLQPAGPNRPRERG